MMASTRNLTTTSNSQQRMEQWHHEAPMKNQTSPSQEDHRQKFRDRPLRSMLLMVILLTMVCGQIGLFAFDTGLTSLGNIEDENRMHWPKHSTRSASLHLNAIETNGDQSQWLEPQRGIILNSGCFISASAFDFAGIGLILGICMMGLLIGLRLIIHGCAENNADSNPIQRP
jgi:hypothetical protein